MTTTEHLNAIKTKCLELLAIAEKRQSGPWIDSDGNLIATDRYVLGVTFTEHIKGASHWPIVQANRAFIASAAGPFEASLRSTIAAIDGLLEIYDHPDEQVAREIIAAWPIELL